MTLKTEELTQRVGRLERENRWLKLLATAVVLASIVLVSVGLGRKPRTIEAEKIVLLDSRGRARVTIGTPEFAGAAVLLKPDAPAIWLSDESGTDRAILMTDGLMFGNGRGKPLVELSANAERGGPELRFYGSDGRVFWTTRRR